MPYNQHFKIHFSTSATECVYDTMMSLIILNSLEICKIGDLSGGRGEIRTLGTVASTSP